MIIGQDQYGYNIIRRVNDYIVFIVNNERIRMGLNNKCIATGRERWENAYYLVINK